jgi:hypothetical protein
LKNFLFVPGLKNEIGSEGISEAYIDRRQLKTLGEKMRVQDVVSVLSS